MWTVNCNNTGPPLPAGGIDGSVCYRRYRYRYSIYSYSAAADPPDPYDYTCRLYDARDGMMGPGIWERERTIVSGVQNVSLKLSEVTGRFLHSFRRVKRSGAEWGGLFQKRGNVKGERYTKRLLIAS